MAQDRPEPTAIRWSDLRTRVVSAAILAPLAIGAIWIGGPVWSAVILALAAGLSIEWVHVCGENPRDLAGIALPAVVLAAGAAAMAGQERAALLLLALGAAAICLAGPRGPARLRGRTLFVAGGAAYVGLACVCMLWLRDADAGRANVLFMMFVVWASDVGAYAAGRLIGGPKLAPRISPKKTWSGALGGIAAAILVGLAVAAAVAGPAGLGVAAGIAALLAAVSQAGDLAESLLKRRFGVKDSGRLIPGHGGLLDRLDGVLAAAPMTAMLALLTGPGVVLWQ